MKNRVHTKPLRDVFSPGTREGFEGYNSALASAVAERAAVEQERSAVLEDAYAGRGAAPSLRKKLDALRDRLLQADIGELQAFGRLPELEAAARRDWTAEASRIKPLLEARKTEVEAAAANLGMAEKSAQRHRLVLEDKERIALEQSWKQAVHEARQRIATEEDAERVGELRASIGAALK
ncbi:MAG TPA: hypothetical protein DCM68_05125 [Verrucomicrobia bacterium]|nr:hypothetical protein [Verrucomicrobiota bacterium]